MSFFDFRSQRKGDLDRAAARQSALKTARDTRRILDGYVRARGGPDESPLGSKVLWGRVVVAVLLLVLAAVVVAVLVGRR